VKTKIYLILLLVLIGCLSFVTVYPCGLEYTFRAYLDKRFWQPFAKYEDTISKSGLLKNNTKEALPNGEKTSTAFAGFSLDPANEELRKVRVSYVEGSYNEAKNQLEIAKKALLTVREKEELQLIEAKLDMRIAEQATPSDKELLMQARLKLEAFLKTSQDPSWRSEARGWLAHVQYLLGQYSSAVKIYLDELDMVNSVFDRDSILNSLHIIFPYNGSSALLVDHLEEYFDTPAHALFVVYIVTNPIYSEGDERAAMAQVAQTVINTLQTHRELFNDTDLSDLLVMALMRASIYMGDTQSAVKYSKKISKTSKMVETPEFNWMTASCYFLQKEYLEVEGPLLKIVHSKASSPNELRAATQALIGVYQKLGRHVDQLHAAFLYEKVGDAVSSEPNGLEQYAVYLPSNEWLLDTPYLLDVQLTDDDLKEYLKSYGKEAGRIKYLSYHTRSRTAGEAVEYELAVRLARQEKYEEAAEIYKRINAWPRYKRMQELNDLYNKVTDTKLSIDEHLNAQYEYASFLEAHSTQIFFNDMLWYGFQTWTFTGRYGVESQGVTAEERVKFLEDERRVKDDQEERWRAYQYLTKVIEQSGYSDLGKKAAIKAIRCLDLINIDRFGREDEINQARAKLLNWLDDYRNRITKKTKSSLHAEDLGIASVQ
jgi:hypothetical protein